MSPARKPKPARAASPAKLSKKAPPAKLSKKAPPAESPKKAPPAPAANPLRLIPAIEVLLQDDGLRERTSGLPRRLVVQAVREAVDEMRQALAKPQSGPGGSRAAAGGNASLTVKTTDAAALRTQILAAAELRIRRTAGPYYRKVINATGIILHTALGRAVLAEAAIAQLAREMSGYSLLQADPSSGKRDRRDGRIEWLLQQLTGAEAATVVNNNSAATMIVLNTIGAGKEVIVSRGQLVEIGGSFRLPDVMAASGAKLVEVGTTNKTHARDYEQAITENTAAILRVHPSNYRIQGFTAEVPLEELAAIAHARNLVMIDDVGAGALLDFRRFGFQDEPLLRDSIRGGADLVTCSGDKLIGASQAGLILGSAKLIEAVRKNPLARIVRVGKLTLTVLEATLSLFFDEELAVRKVPTLRMLARELPDIERQAEWLAHTIRGQVGERATVTVIAGASQMGSGSLPTQDIPTRLVAVAPRVTDAETLARRLREHRQVVFARIQKDQLLLDPRTLQEGDGELLAQAVVETLLHDQPASAGAAAATATGQAAPPKAAPRKGR